MLRGAIEIIVARHRPLSSPGTCRAEPRKPLRGGPYGSITLHTKRCFGGRQIISTGDQCTVSARVTYLACRMTITHQKPTAPSVNLGRLGALGLRGSRQCPRVTMQSARRLAEDWPGTLPVLQGNCRWHAVILRRHRGRWISASLLTVCAGVLTARGIVARGRLAVTICAK